MNPKKHYEYACKGDLTPSQSFSAYSGESCSHVDSHISKNPGLLGFALSYTQGGTSLCA